MMSNLKRYKESGWSSFWALGILLSCAIGASSFGVLAQLIPSSGKLIVPWVLVSLFLLPVTLSLQLLAKYNEFPQNSGLLESEKRRLKAILKEKKRQLFITIGYCVFAAVAIVVMFAFSSHSFYLMKLALVIAGGLLGVSICSIPIIISEGQEVADFKQKIEHRLAQKKAQKAMLKKLNLSNEQ